MNDFNLGKDFLVAHKATLDFINSLVHLPDVVVEFTSPKRKFIVSTVSDVRISAKTTVAVQTKLQNLTKIVSYSWKKDFLRTVNCVLLEV